VKNFFIGVFSTFFALIVIAAGWLFSGGMPMATSGGPLPLETAIAGIALHAAIGKTSELRSPILADEPNLLNGAKNYKIHCAVCHGLPNHPASAISIGLFPPAPALMPPKKGVTDDPVGETYWKVKNGIRLTGMPGFEKSLSENEIWQLANLLFNADKLPPTVLESFSRVNEK
jgi:thiosulfate dehydrogenase